MKQFTPLFDDITAKYGVITAAVYGCIWRRCQMDRGVCDASLQTMADDLGISRRTIVTHVKLLVNDGCVTDLTPENDRKPHKYLVQEMQQSREIDSISREFVSLDGDGTRELNAGGGEVDSLALGKQMHQTRELNAHKDTDTIRDNIRDKENIYIHPLPDEIQELITAISQTVKTAYGPKTEDDFEAAAYSLFGWDVTRDKVCDFGSWWKTNGYYPGKPALKSFMDEFRNYLDGVAIKAEQNGHGVNGVHHTLKGKEIKQVKGEF